MELKKVFFFAFPLFFIFMSFSFVSSEFDVQNLLLKVSVAQGDAVNKSISISSSTGEQIAIESNIKWISFDKIVSLEQGEGRRINIIFNSSSLYPGIYLGEIKFKGIEEVVSVPIIFEVESKDLFFDVNVDIPPQYSDVSPGDKFLAQVKIFDLTNSGATQKGLGAVTVGLDYEVRDLEGNIVVSESESNVVNGQLLLTKQISIPDSINRGDYLLAVTAKYKSSVGTSSRIFRVVEKKEAEDKNDSFSIQPYLYILFALLFFIVLLLIFVYLLKDRDKMLVELRKYNQSELKQQRKFLLEQAKMLAKRGKDVKEIDKEVRKKVKLLKNKQKSRIVALKSLKKEGDSKEMEKKLNEWKKAGYNTLALEYKMKGLTEREMAELMKKWKNEGYK